ncbi:MAG: GntR family transcriptional regulator [Sulfobacillus sp.]
MMSIERETGVPLYRQIQDYIRTQIEAKEWVVGDQIPTEQQLGQKFGVSRITVVKAVSRLADEGFLRKEQGRGTFVTGVALVPEPLTLRSFTEEMRARGLQPGSTILDKGIVEPSRRLQDRLNLDPDQKVFRLVRLLLANGQPMGLHRTHLPCHRFPGVLDHIEPNMSLYATLRTYYGIEPESGIETYSAVQLDAEECRLLGIPEGSPAFSVERQTFASGTPFEFVTALMRSDEFHYTVQLHPKK